jgi:hypothetical protein
MAYKPNPDRKVVNGKAVVSAKELADFQAERGSDKTLRDLLNADKGLSRKKESEELPKTTDANVRMSRQSGPPTTTQGATPSKEESAPKTAKARSLVDQGRGVQLYKDVDKEDVLEAGLALASMYPVVRGAKMAYTAARPAIGAAIKRLEDRPSPSFLREKEQPFSKFDTLTPENQAASQAYRNAYDDRPGPMKKGGAVKQYTKGGKINLGACGVSTHVPRKKNSNW